MTADQVDIADMQCWLLRMAQTKWEMPAREVARLFLDKGVFEYISELYGLLHLSGYDAALCDVETYLRSRGVALC